MKSPSKRLQKSGHTLVEMTTVIVIIGITAVAGLASIASYNVLQRGLEGSGDLREIYVAQKKLVVSRLTDPPSLAGYGSSGSVPKGVKGTRIGPLFTLQGLRDEGYLSPGPLKLEEQGAKIDVSLMPPTCGFDGPSSPFPNTAKNPLRAHSGDGLYDVGAEN